MSLVKNTKREAQVAAHSTYFKCCRVYSCHDRVEVRLPDAPSFRGVRVYGRYGNDRDIRWRRWRVGADDRDSHRRREASGAGTIDRSCGQRVRAGRNAVPIELVLNDRAVRWRNKKL